MEQTTIAPNTPTKPTSTMYPASIAAENKSRVCSGDDMNVLRWKERRECTMAGHRPLLDVVEAARNSFLDILVGFKGQLNSNALQLLWGATNTISERFDENIAVNGRPTRMMSAASMRHSMLISSSWKGGKRSVEVWNASNCFISPAACSARNRLLLMVSSWSPTCTTYRHNTELKG
jgi:hypothetical protein